MKDKIEIPFGAKDSELKGWEYTIPEGMEAIIKDGKVIVREKESEGDRIRKYLIEELKAAKSVGELKFTIPQPTREECIAYLERQKEEEGYEAIPVESTLEYKLGFKAGKESEKQKHDWSEEERIILDSIIDDYEKAAKSFCGYDGKIGLLKAIRNGEYNLPKPAEWSEEDEKNLGQVISGKYLPLGLREWFCGLPERFPSRPSWKPSEEQMEALNTVLEHEAERVGSSKELEKANALYEQLKKRM